MDPGERGDELVRGVESAGTTGQLIRVSGDGWEAIRGGYAMPITILFPAGMERLGRFFQKWPFIKDIYAMPLYP